MSDMYLELRSKIPIVAEQTQLGTQRIKDAQARVGLSNEAIARVVHISEKTWRRWKNQGAIPTASLPAAARALRLELHDLDETATADSRDRLERLLGRVIELLEELLAQQPPQAQPGEASERRG